MVKESFLAQFYGKSQNYTDIPNKWYKEYNVKKGLRNEDGTGVRIGLTRVADVVGYEETDGGIKAIPGRLLYRGVDVLDLVKGKKESHFGYEETCFLLLFGYLPKKAELEKFCNVVRHCYTIPDEFVEMNLLRLPGTNLMNKLQDAVLTLYNYDDDPDNIDVYQTLVKGVNLLAKLPSIACYAYQSKVHYYDRESLFIHYANPASVVKVTVNPIKARAAGLTPAQIGGTLNNMLSGTTPTSLNIDGNDIDVKVEYPKERYKTLDQIETITLQTPKGSSVALTDVADIHFADSPASITRQDKQYRVTISGIYTENSTKETKGQLLTDVVMPNVSGTVSIAQNSQEESMATEFAALFQAIALAIFLVFVVMAAQFESPKFSIMVMTTIPFCLIGAFGLLWLADSAISMTSLLGFLMLVGTVVNNGILYVDTVNQYRRDMDLNTALIEAGATRLRPILMTTLTTVVSMVPMAMALGDSGSTTQGLALVNIGGLTASTILSLLMLPAYYSLMNGGGKKRVIISD